MIRLKICYILASSGKSRDTGSCKFQYLITLQKIQECFQFALSSREFNDQGVLLHIYDFRAEDIRH